MPPRPILPLLTGLVALAAPVAGAAELPLDPGFRLGMPMAAAVALARAQGLVPGEAGPLPPDGRRQVVVAVPPADECSPGGAFLLCDGLRLLAEGNRLAMVEGYAAVSPPQPAAALLRQASARFGRPAAAEQVTERQRGRVLRQLRYRWQWRRADQVQRVTLTLLLPEEVAPAPAGGAGVEAIGIGLSLRRGR